MNNRKAISATRQGSDIVDGDCLLLTSPIACLEEGRAVALLAARPDPRRPDEYLLHATLVPEQPLPSGLRLIAEWQGEQHAAAVDKMGCAYWRQVPASVIQALQGGDQEALVLRIE